MTSDFHASGKSFSSLCGIILDFSHQPNIPINEFSRDYEFFMWTLSFHLEKGYFSMAIKCYWLKHQSYFLEMMKIHKRMTSLQCNQGRRIAYKVCLWYSNEREGGCNQHQMNLLKQPTKPHSPNTPNNKRWWSWSWQLKSFPISMKFP
jgi:hypothetical protein